MTYTDTLFVLLLVVVVLSAAALRRAPAVREWALTAFSALLIASWGLIDLAIMVVVLLLNYVAVKAMVRAKRRAARTILVAAICADLAILSVFKYSNFILENVSAFLPFGLPSFPLGIPLAISFYTFHLISYLVDVHKGAVRDVPLRHYLFYLTFFPHVVAGPIVRVWQLVPQIGRTHRRRRDLSVGFHYLVLGFFLKAVAADNIAAGIDPVWAGTATASVSAIDRWLVAALYYCQIYGDFAGYSLMALGMARLLGYRLPANFRTPMLAASLQEFWRRWHITLSHWLRDYLYIPLGGSRVRPPRAYANVIVTMLLGGLWHGAGWGFLVWGAMHGVGLAAERALGFQRTRILVGRWLGWWIVTQAWVTIAWVFFRAPDLGSALDFLHRMVSFGSVDAFQVDRSLAARLVFALPILAHHCVPLVLPRVGRRNLPLLLGVSTGVMLVLSISVYSPPKTFIYFRF